MHYIFLGTFLGLVVGAEVDIHVELRPSHSQCFKFEGYNKKKIKASYKVLDMSHGGSMDVEFNWTQPRGAVIVSENDKCENIHHHNATRNGLFTYCLKNSHEKGHKYVYLGLFIEDKDGLTAREDVNLLDRETGTFLYFVVVILSVIMYFIL